MFTLFDTRKRAGQTSRWLCSITKHDVYRLGLDAKGYDIVRLECGERNLRSKQYVYWPRLFIY